MTVSKENWSLNRKGYESQQRHSDKLRDIIKDNIKDVIADEAIILPDSGRGIIKIPNRTVKEYQFIFDQNKNKHIGSGDGTSKEGDVIGSAGEGNGSGKGKGEAGEEPGEDYIEVSVDLDELSELLFKDFVLPDLDLNKTPLLTNDKVEFTDIRKNGIRSNINRKMTILEAIKRNALNNTGKTTIAKEDLRFKTWEVKQQLESNAVVIAMMDTSGSMGQWEKYIARTFFFWMMRFLKTKYNKVTIRFLAHHTEAKEVDEHEFFNKGESGGTRCSSVYQLALDIIKKDYGNNYNIYPYHITDGDNIGSDSEKCVKLVNQLLEYSNLFGYAEALRTHYSSTLISTYKRHINNPKFRAKMIRDRSEIYDTLKSFFSEGDEK